MRSLKSSIGNLQFSMLSLLLAAGMLAALAPRAEAVTATATGGTVTEYKQGGKQWRAFVFTNNPVSEIPTMTANNAPSGVASASSEQTVGITFAAWLAMDKNGGTRWSSSGAMPQWLQYQFASGKVINGYEFIGAFAHQTPSNFTLQASNDGSNWTTLDTQTGKSAMTQYYTFSNTVSYTYYRLNVTAVGGGGANTVSLTEFILYSMPSLAVTDGGDVEYLVVAAGGAGGTTYDTGGGGAGGMLTGSVTLAAGTYPVFVGWGVQGSGKDSIFSTLKAIGGGAGSSGSPGSGAAGGSGGGSVRSSLAGGEGTPGQGNKGGDGHSSNWTGGGGGGAGGPGVDANATDLISAGGPGVSSTISGSVSPVVYAAGGKGYHRSGSDSDKATPGAANTGNGGHGGANGVPGGKGGSGIVIVRYALPPKGTLFMMR